MSQEKTLVVMLCMHRCGSSLTARLLQRLGMSLGPFDLGETNESNKYGHFEAQPFVLLNREIQLRHFGFEGDLPGDPETFERYCRNDGRWISEEGIAEADVARGRDLVAQLMESGPICGFKDPRTVLAWPFWQQVFASMPGLRVVPLLLVRGPHEIAMSIFRRSQSDRDYAEALEVTAVHFRRMRAVRDRWTGPQATVQFDPQAYRGQVQHASGLCGLAWSEAAFAESYDASCRHHEAAVIDHPAQAAFEALTGPPSHSPPADNEQRLSADAALREATLRQRHRLLCQERDAARAERDAAWEVANARWHENNALHEIVATIPPLEARLAQANYELGLIRSSRTWRVREALVQALHRERKVHASH